MPRPVNVVFRIEGRSTSDMRVTSSCVLTYGRIMAGARTRWWRRWHSTRRCGRSSVGEYGEASTGVHELLDIAVERATRDSRRFLGARSQAEARGYFTSSMRRAWGVAFVREMRWPRGRVSGSRARGA